MQLFFFSYGQAYGQWYNNYQCVEEAYFNHLRGLGITGIPEVGSLNVPIFVNQNGVIPVFEVNKTTKEVSTLPLNADGTPQATSIPNGYRWFVKWASSECATNYRAVSTHLYANDDVEIGNCNSCSCANQATNIACNLLPDLIISPWKIAYTGGSPQGNLLEPDIFQLKIHTFTANIGEGPFEIRNTGIIDPLSNDEIVKQRIYSKPNPPQTADWAMVKTDSDGVNNALLLGSYHAEHSHFHINNWLQISLRKRPNSNHPNYNKPYAWEVIGNVNKISFCIVESDNSACDEQHNRFSMLNLSNQEQIDYTTNNPNFWNDPNLANTLQSAEINDGKKRWLNDLSDFPNYRLGEVYYSCTQGYQGFSPGTGDDYASHLIGNSINLPCNLAPGLYYIVGKVNPNNIFHEKDTTNNIAIVPWQFNGFGIPTTGSTIFADEFNLPGQNEQNVIWESEQRFHSQVVVKSGVTLTIRNTTIEFTTPESGITVEKGGKLLLQNATLKGNDCLGNIWKGITVLGDPNAIQPTNYANGSPNHGLVSLSQSTIQDALIGIHSYKGGIVITLGSDITPLGYPINRNIFKNNSVGILFNQYNYYLTPIEYCDFINDAAFKAAHVYEHYRNILLLAAYGPANLKYYANKIFIGKNTFTNTQTDNAVTGIATIFSGTSIGKYTPSITPDSTYKNKFTNLDAAIDAYAYGPSLKPRLQVIGNIFTNNKKTITANGLGFANLISNSIQVAPGINLAGQDTYGIFLQACTGFKVGENAISTGQTAINSDTRGLVIGNSGSQGGNIYHNTFIGRFEAATQFQGNNSTLNLQCNQYTHASKYDWLIFSGIIAQQGACYPNDPNLNDPSYNQWHPNCSNGNDYHIFNNTATPFTIVPFNSPQFIPTCNSGIVDVNTCDQSGADAACLPQYKKATAEEIKAQLQAYSNNPRLYAKQFNELMQTRLQNDEYEQAKADAQAETKNIAKQVNVATLTDEEQFDNALLGLEQIPLDNDENKAFYEAYKAILTLLGSELGNGKTQSQAQAALDQQEQLDNGSLYCTIAQSYMAYSQQKTYPRSAGKMQYNTTPFLQINTHLNVQPNPANSLVRLCLNSVNNLEQSITIYDCSGTLITTINVNNRREIDLDSSNYKNGLYICKLSYANGKYATAKFIVIH